jgi:hypothetical protein
LIKKTKNGKGKDQRQGQEGQEDQEGGSGDASGQGGAAGGGGTGRWVPSYYDLLGYSSDEKELIGLAEQSLFAQRISLKSQGHEVTALSKMQKLRKQLAEPGVDPNIQNQASGMDVEQHPELAESEGYVDPNIIVLPESEAVERASNDPKLQNKLRNRLAARMGMGSDLSMQSLKAEYEKKMRERYRPAPQEEPRPRFRPTETPKYRPQ